MDFDPSGPHTPGPTDIPNVILVLIHRAITCDSFKVLAEKA